MRPRYSTTIAAYACQDSRQRITCTVYRSAAHQHCGVVCRTGTAQGPPCPSTLPVSVWQFLLPPAVAGSRPRRANPPSQRSLLQPATLLALGALLLLGVQSQAAALLVHCSRRSAAVGAVIVAASPSLREVAWTFRLAVDVEPIFISHAPSAEQS
mmetsp:Transcript_17535/g.49820  ORF Transcript_17535/g.49820 Transcript_17535/m.49820 type:complete len:155 (+) Transcript_17535:482-946(+)